MTTRTLSTLWRIVAEAMLTTPPVFLPARSWDPGLCMTVDRLAQAGAISNAERSAVQDEINSELAARNAERTREGFDHSRFAYDAGYSDDTHRFGDPGMTADEARNARVLAALLFAERAKSEGR